MVRCSLEKPSSEDDEHAEYCDKCFHWTSWSWGDASYLTTLTAGGKHVGRGVVGLGGARAWGEGWGPSREQMFPPSCGQPG